MSKLTEIERKELQSINLSNHQYPLEILEKYGNYLCKNELLKTQKLDAKFIAKYILNDDVKDSVDIELKLSFNYVLKYQPWIYPNELGEWIIKTPNSYF